LTVSVRDLLSAKTKDLLKHSAEEDLTINIYSNMYTVEINRGNKEVFRLI